MQLHFLFLILLAFPYLSVCRDLKGDMMSPEFPPPSLPFQPPPSTLFTPPETLFFPPPPPLPLLPSEPDIPVTICSPPPPPVPPISHCCVLVPPPARTTPSFLQRFVASAFGRITIVVIIAVVGYIFYQVYTGPRDPTSSRCQLRHPQSESSSTSRPTINRLPPPLPSLPRITRGLGDFVPDGFDIGM